MQYASLVSCAFFLVYPSENPCLHSLSVIVGGIKHTFCLTWNVLSWRILEMFDYFEPLARYTVTISYTSAKPYLSTHHQPHPPSTCSYIRADSLFSPSVCSYKWVRLRVPPFLKRPQVNKDNSQTLFFQMNVLLKTP